MTKKTPGDTTDVVTTAKHLLNDYVTKELVSDFSAVPVFAKLELLQKTPQQFIEERVIDGKVIHYVKHQYSKKCLNFIFNFHVSNDVVKEEYIEYDEKFKRKEPAAKGYKYIDDIRHVIEAEATVKFTFFWPDGSTSCRTVKGSHKQYKNRAINRGHAMQAAISKCWTLVAATFGVGADLEDDLYKDSKTDPEDDVIDGEVVTGDTPVEKEFAPNF